MSSSHQCNVDDVSSSESDSVIRKTETLNLTPARPRRLNMMKFCDNCDTLHQSGLKCPSCYPAKPVPPWWGTIGYLFCPFFSFLHPSLDAMQNKHYYSYYYLIRSSRNISSLTLINIFTSSDCQSSRECISCWKHFADLIEAGNQKDSNKGVRHVDAITLLEEI